MRRYSFHGLSYEYVVGRLREVAPDIANGRVITAHLGSGAVCSCCRFSKGKVSKAPMGFTALDGLPMGTRCGQIDPGVLLYLLDQKGMSPEDVQNLLYNESGLKGLSGVSNDVRVLLASEDSAPASPLIISSIGSAPRRGAGGRARWYRRLRLYRRDRRKFSRDAGKNSGQAGMAPALGWTRKKISEANCWSPSPTAARSSMLCRPTKNSSIARHTLKLIGG